MNIIFCDKLFLLPFYSRYGYSTLINAHPPSQNLFSHFVSTKFNMSEADINRMIKLSPSLQRLQTLDNIERFVDMLSRYGCSEVQIAKIMMTQPRLVVVSAERILKPKIKLLEDFGFQGETLVKLLTRNPTILVANLENGLFPKMEFLKRLFQSQELFIESLLKVPNVLPYNLEKTLKPSLVFWERWGFQGKELLQLIRIDPYILRFTSLTPAQTDLIQKIGAKKESNLYKYIVCTVATGRIETLNAKVDNLKLCGLSAEETWQLCRAAPYVLKYSKVKVSEMMKFVVKDMELPPNCIVKHARLFNKNLEKVMKPRFLAWQKIKSMNGPSLSLFTVLTMPEARFIRNVIRGHPESTTLWTIYQNAISNASNHGQSSI